MSLLVRTNNEASSLFMRHQRHRAGPGTILFLVTEDHFFVSHRLSFAAHLLKEGYKVAVGCRFSGQEGRIRDSGISAIPLQFRRENASPLAGMKDCFEIRRIISLCRPDIVHLVSLRPILLAGLSHLVGRSVPFVNAITGLGSMFTGDLCNWRLRFTQRLILLALAPVFRHKLVYNVFQNKDDLRWFIQKKFSRPENSFLIRGAGVDFDLWDPKTELDNNPPVVLYVGRLLRDKGVEELVHASKALANQQIAHKLRIIGAPDPCNPKSFTRFDIQDWVKGGKAEYLGKRADILEQMSSANIIVLPSYREGLPKVLLEAGLAARAVITTDVPGCRELVKHEDNGLLVPARNSHELAKAIRRLIDAPQYRHQLAARHHNRVAKEFSLRRVTEDFLQLYKRVLSEAWS